ncbi:MAG: peptidoglycan-associated lipoprotein Pal [Methyloprofundus sp.]|nr:peptidoglycan-associated lipoprotein Pal [Methyloprofundus sp.]
MTNYKKIVALLMMVMFLSACSKDVAKGKLGTEDEANVQNIGYNDDGNLDVETIAIGEGESGYVAKLMQSEAFSDPSSPLSKRVIYFEYDSSDVRQEFIAVIEAHAIYLTNNPNQTISLEGHSDERGTREYNIALAEQRAKSVYKMLQVLGVMDHQVNVVSYGEEKPESLGQTEEVFSLNRRVEVVYK